LQVRGSEAPVLRSRGEENDGLLGWRLQNADPTTDEKNGQAKIASSASQDAVVINSKKKKRGKTCKFKASNQQIATNLTIRSSWIKIC
jgi:hypothetical protein